MTTLTVRQIQETMLKEAREKVYVVKHDKPENKMISSIDSSITKSMFDFLNLSAKSNKYSNTKKFGDNDNPIQAMNNLRSEYNEAILKSPNLYKEVATAALAITNPESFPDASNPFVHNLTLVPFAAGNIARSIPNVAAPINSILGATTYSAKISRGYDRLKDLYEGKPYIRPQIGLPPVRELYGHYGAGGTKAPYGDILTPTTIEQYRDRATTNIYSPNKPRIDSQGIKEFSELAYDANQDKIDYAKLFGDSLGNKMFQQPLVIAKRNEKYLMSKSFFEKGSSKVHRSEDVIYGEFDHPSNNLPGVIDFNTQYGINFSSIESEIFFPFVITDMRTRMGILIRPFSEEFPKDQLSISVDEDSYIGRVGTIPKWKNASRKVSLNFFIIAESQKELPYVQDKINFLKNCCLPIYKQQTVGDSDSSINLSLISTSPIVEIRYGNYLYDVNSIGVAKGLICMISSFEADPFRFNWEVEEGKQVPQGYRCTLEALVINRDNPGPRINQDGSITYTKFYDIGE